MLDYAILGSFSYLVALYQIYYGILLRDKTRHFRWFQGPGVEEQFDQRFEAFWVFEVDQHWLRLFEFLLRSDVDLIHAKQKSQRNLHNNMINFVTFGGDVVRPRPQFPSLARYRWTWIEKRQNLALNINVFFLIKCSISLLCFQAAQLSTFYAKNIVMKSYHWKYLTSNLTSVYLMTFWC